MYELDKAEEIKEIVRLTKESYDSLTNKDPEKIYIVVTNFAKELKGE